MVGVVLFQRTKRLVIFVNLMALIYTLSMRSILNSGFLIGWGVLIKACFHFKEKHVLIKLLNGWSMSRLAIADGTSYKTISAHKRNGLTKLGVKSINLLVNKASCDVLKVL